MFTGLQHIGWNIKNSSVDIRPIQFTSNCVYLFTFTCGSKYVGRTKRNLSTRISEHLPKRLLLNGSKLLSSSIGKHILNYGHAVDRIQSFRILAKLRTPQILCFAEACAIRRIKPDLCVQKDFFVHLALPW